MAGISGPFWERKQKALPSPTQARVRETLFTSWLKIQEHIADRSNSRVVRSILSFHPVSPAARLTRSLTDSWFERRRGDLTRGHAELPAD